MFGKTGLWSFNRRKKEEKEGAFKDRVSLAVYILESTVEKLRSITEALSRREERYFEKCIEAVVSEDSSHATMYAGECAEIRRLVGLVMGSQLALEKACLRLNTVSTFGDVLSNISPMMELVTETGRRLKGIVPSVTGKLEQVDIVLKASLSDMGSTSDPQTKHQEVENILEDANKAAEEVVRNRFPDIPSALTAELEKPPAAVALTEGAAEVAAIEDPAASTIGPVKDMVYDYLRERNGNLSIAECASELGVTPKEVEQTILQLRDEGKVAL
jgi:division protein CdvB (Snf7/Vps24/ESCRT-III family)